MNDQGNQLGGRALAPEEAASESEDRERSLLDSNPPPTVNQYTSLAPQIAPTCRERRAERLRRLRQSQQRGEESEILPARFPLLTFHPMTVDAPPVATITITPPPELAEAIDSENMSTSNVEENVRDTQGDHGDSHPNEEENVGSRTDGTGDSGRHHGDDRGGLMDHRGEEDKDHEKHHPKGDDKDGLKSDDKDEKNDHLNSQFKVKKIDMLRHQRIHHARVEPHHHGKTGSHKLKGRVLSNHRNKPVYGHKDDSDSDSPHLFKDEYEFEPYRRPGNDFIEPADLSLGYHSHRTLKDELRGAWDDSSDEDDEGNGDTNGNQNRTKQLIKTSIFTAAAYVRKVLAYSACKITVFLCRLVYCILCVLIALVIWALFVLALYLVVSGGNIELLLSQ